jgi:SAM-dependent methyltransferase
MQDVIRTIDTCRVCGADDWLEVYSFGSHPLANGFLEPAATLPYEPAYPLDVVVCRHCRLMSIRHEVRPDVMFSDYVYVTSESALIAGHMATIVEWAHERAGLTRGDLVVELGSNVGTQLTYFQRRGLRVFGVDPAANLIEIANAAGVPSRAAFFGRESAAGVAAEHGRAKFVLGRQCFAHIPDVHDVLDGVNEVIADDGVLAIEVPYLVDLLAENQFDTIFHEHVSYYSVSTLDRLFTGHGLRLIDVQRAPVHGGSIIVFATPQNSPVPTRDTVADILRQETALGLHTDRPYLQFAANTAEVIDHIRDLVRGLVAMGKRVAGYGAPSKGCALLQFCGLTSAEIEFISDTTKGKQGKLTPGTHVPVCSPEEARNNPPDYYLLLAWNYAEEIITNEHEFLAAGGRFVVPIPSPRVVSTRSRRAAAA